MAMCESASALPPVQRISETKISKWKEEAKAKHGASTSCKSVPIRRKHVTPINGKIRRPIFFYACKR
jgi:hypothetical protein